MYTCMHTRLRYRHCANVLGQFFLLLAFSYMCSTRPLMRLVRVSACVRGDVCLRVCTHSPIILLFLSFKAVSSKYRSPKSSSLLEHHAQDCFFSRTSCWCSLRLLQCSAGHAGKLIIVGPMIKRSSATILKHRFEGRDEQVIRGLQAVIEQEQKQ